MSELHPAAGGLLLLFVGLVAAVDLCTRRIPNALTVSGAAVGMAACLWSAGVFGLLQSAAGLGVGLIAFLPFYLGGGFGAGDVKAMAAVGAFLGPKGALLAAACTLVAGGVGGMIVLLVHGGFGSLGRRVHEWTLRAWSVYATGKLSPTAGHILGGAAKQRFPYGLAIACGTLVSIAWS